VSLPADLSLSTINTLYDIACSVKQNDDKPTETMAYILANTKWLTSNDYKQRNDLIGFKSLQCIINGDSITYDTKFANWHSSLQLFYYWRDGSNYDLFKLLNPKIDITNYYNYSEILLSNANIE
jgi:hypothetical protein